MNHIVKLIFSFGLISCTALAQTDLDTTRFNPRESGLFPKEYQKALSNISVSGYYRFFGNYSNMKTQYPEMGDLKNRLFIGDDSNLPQLSLNLGIRPSKNTSVSTDLYLWTPLTGSEQDYVEGLLLGVNLYGNHSTKYGNFGVKTGGIHWYRLSGMTFSANTGYNRFSMFERNPWDPNMLTLFDRYETYYQNGALTQDVRWGQQAFQGFIFEGADLPQDFSVAFMHGKSQLNGGFSTLPNSLTGGKLMKNFGTNFVSLNGIRSQTFSDSLASALVGFNLLTTEYQAEIQDKITFSGEIGAGNYFSPTATGTWGEAIDVKINFSKELTYFPIELRYFRISPNVINNNGSFWNSSIQEYNQNTASTDDGQAPLLFPFASSLTQIGQLTNNRQGIILNTDLQYKRVKLALGYSVASELEAISDRITYGHPANNLALSRFWRWAFPSNVGPYGNISKIFRGVYETMQITDDITTKGFNSIEANLKTQMKIFNRDLMIFYLGGFHSVQREVSVTPVFNKTAYLQSYNQQLEFYYAITRDVVLCNYFGYDRIYGGENTTRSPSNGEARYQIGFSYACGLDIQLSKNTGLYLRQRWMKYQDLSFLLDRYQGMESTVELKIYF